MITAHNQRAYDRHTTGEQLTRNGQHTDYPRTYHGRASDRLTDCTRVQNGRATDVTRAYNGHKTGGTRTSYGLTTDLKRTDHGLLTDKKRTGHGQETDGPRFGLRVGSWILVFGKRRAGEIATLRLYHVCSCQRHQKDSLAPHAEFRAAKSPPFYP